MIVYIEGKEISIREPRKVTLEKYGLTLNNWKEILATQGYRCPVCGNVLAKTSNIDHFHQRNWKKLPAEKRKMYVRGVLCFFCNKYYVGRSITVQKAKNVVTYLEQFEKRKPK